MKAKKIVALVAGFAVAATMTVGLSACGKGPQPLGTTTLNLADYAADIMEDNGIKGFASAREFLRGDITDLGRYLIKNDGNYSVYDLMSEKYILANLASKPSYTSIGSLNVWKVRSEFATNYNYTYSYYDQNGQPILADGAYSNLACRTLEAYVGTDTKTSTVYLITGKKDIGQVEVYLKRVVDEETRMVSYTKVLKSDVKKYGPQYAVDAEISLSSESVYEESEYLPVEGEITNYKYNQIGSVMTFYKGTEKTGSVDLTANGEMLNFVGNCMYYSVTTPYVPKEHDGYNLSYTSMGEFKCNYSLYKYDIVANTTTQINCDVAISGISPLYNYETKAYDAAIITGYKMTNGVVAIPNGDTPVAPERFTYLVDGNMNVAYDITGKFNNTPYLYELDEGKFLAIEPSGDGYIVDKDFNVLRDNVNVSDVCLGEDVIRFRGENGYGLTDLDGKVIVPPEYNNIYNFYGGVALAEDLQGEKILLDINGAIKTTKISDLEKAPDADTQKVITTTYNGYYIIETKGYDNSGMASTVIGKAYRAYDGTLLKSFDHGNVTEITVGKNTYLRETIDESVYVYYKLV